MEERGIGRPSTYAPTISTIIDRDYVTKENKALRPTPLGEGVTGLLVDEFKSVADYEFTANMEQRLDSVEEGKTAWKDVLREFYTAMQQYNNLTGGKVTVEYLDLNLNPTLRDQYADITPGYYMNKEHWNSVNLNGAVPDNLLKDMVEKSYRLVLGGLSKKAQLEILEGKSES